MTSGPESLGGGQIGKVSRTISESHAYMDGKQLTTQESDCK